MKLKRGKMTKVYKRIKLASILFSLFILILFTYSIVNYSLLKNQIDESLNQQVLKYGYIAVFILSFILEVSPQPFASAIIPYTNGLVLGLDFKTLLIITLLGVISASFTAYILGIYYGRKITIKIIGEENYQKSFELFKKYGKFGMTIAALTPIPYFPIVAGLFKMDFTDFLIYAMTPRIIHFLVLGYVLFLVL